METVRRKTYLDILRIIACIGVIFNHVAGSSALDPNATLPTLRLFEYFLCKTAVPIFFMISGALLLPRVDPYRKSAWRMLRILIVLAIFVPLSIVIFDRTYGLSHSVLQIVRFIVYDDTFITGTYWFLFRYMGVLAMLPILQRLLPRMRRADMLYFLFFSVVIVGSYNACAVFCPQIIPAGGMQLPLFAPALGAALLGYCLDRAESTKHRLLIACGVLLAANAVAATLMYLANTVYASPNAALLDSCEQPAIILTAAAIFFLVRAACSRFQFSDRAATAVSRIGRLTFCVYLVQDILIYKLAFIRSWITARMSLYFADRLYVLFIFAVALLIAAVLTRIPLLKKLL